MYSSVVFLLKFRKQGLTLDDMHIVTLLAQRPVAIRHLVHSAEEILIVIKRSALGSSLFNFHPNLLRQSCTEDAIKVGENFPSVLKHEIKSDITYFHITARSIVAMDDRICIVVYVFSDPTVAQIFIKTCKHYIVEIFHKGSTSFFSKATVRIGNSSKQHALTQGKIAIRRIVFAMPVLAFIFAD